ncbi:hypothetical protein [Pleomorphomonas sp. PLEO]|uniref:hypothetical protein n=1 Tax=Pleomorphomonas sp. PLEO TaxID=3239306 RepID=UPI00351F0B0E
MPVVPTYQDRGIALQPGLNFRDNTHATGEMFGSQVGEALVKAGQGVGDLGRAVAEVKDLDATNEAKDSHNGLIEQVRALGYGEGGYLGTSGRSAVEGYTGYEAAVRQAVKDGAKGLSPLALAKYMDAANATAQGALATGEAHAMEGRKAWTVKTGEARIAAFQGNAVAQRDDPNAVTENTLAALTEYREIGKLMGWPEGEVTDKGLGLVSGVYEDIALKKATTDLVGAMAFVKENAPMFTDEARKRLDAGVGAAALDEETRRGALAFVSGKRASPDAPDMTAAPSPANSEQPDAQRPGPTLKRAALLDHAAAGTDPSMVLGLDNGFAGNLSAFIEDAPAEIRPGLRLEFSGRAGDGQPDAPTNTPRAANLTFNGDRLDAAPSAVQDWALRTAGKYGLRLPAGIGLQAGDPNSGRLVAASDGVSARAAMPSLANAEDYLQTIPDPRRRELARQTILDAWELRSREEGERQSAAKAELWRQIDSGATPDDIPFDVRQAAGMDAMTAARTYYSKKLADQAIVTDPVILRDLRLTAASRPQYFANLDLSDYRHSLSDGDYRDMTEKQAGIIENDRAAREKGPDLVTAFDMAQTQLDAAGMLKPKKEQTEEDRQRLARFQNDLYGEIAALQAEKPGHVPNPLDFRWVINKLLLPILIKTPGVLWDSETPARLFDAKHLKDGQTYEVNVLPEDIPVDLRGGIRKELQWELDGEPTDKQVGAEYAAMVLGKPSPFAGTRRKREEVAMGIRRDAALKGR